MKLIVPHLSPAAVLQAMALAQSAPDAFAILAHESMQSLLQQSAVSLRLVQWEWPAEEGGLMETELAQRIRWRKPLDELRTAGLTGVVYCAGAVDAPCVTQTLAARLAAWLSLPLSLPFVSAFASASASVGSSEPADSAAPAYPRLFAHADALARVAHLFRQVPASKTGSFRFIWVLEHADATQLARQHEHEFTAFVKALNAHAVHLHVLRVVPDGMSPLLLARDEGLRQWQQLLQRCAMPEAGSVVDLGAVQGLSGCGALCALLAHADVVLHATNWVEWLAKGLGKLEMRLSAANVLRGADNAVGAGSGLPGSAESSIVSMVCERFPFIVKP